MTIRCMERAIQPDPEHAFRVRGALSETINPAFKASEMGFIDSVDAGAKECGSRASW